MLAFAGFACELCVLDFECEPLLAVRAGLCVRALRADLCALLVDERASFRVLALRACFASFWMLALARHGNRHKPPLLTCVHRLDRLAQ